MTMTVMKRLKSFMQCWDLGFEVFSLFKLARVILKISEIFKYLNSKFQKGFDHHCC